MKCKVGKEPDGGRKKCKKVGNKSPWADMFQKPQTVNDLNKTKKLNKEERGRERERERSKK